MMQTSSASYSKEYRREASRKWREKNKGPALRAYDNERQKAWRSNPATWSRYAVIRARASAKRRELPCNLEISDLVLPAACPILGTAFVLNTNGPCAPTLDRVDNSRGYVKGNVRIISKRANELKGSATPAELRAILRYMEYENDA